MAEDKNKKEKQQKYMELQMMQQHMQQVQQQMQKIDQQMLELKNMEESIAALKEVKAGNEIFLPICSGVFVKAKIENTDELLVNVGSDVVVKKSNEQTQKMISEQIVEIEKYKEEMKQQMQSIMTQAAMTEQEMEK